MPKRSATPELDDAKRVKLEPEADVPEVTGSQTEVWDFLEIVCAGCKQTCSGFPKFKIVGDKHLEICCDCDNADPTKQGIPEFADARQVSAST